MNPRGRARSTRWGRCRASTRTSSPTRSRQPRYDAAEQPGRELPAAQPGDQTARTRPARRSSRSPPRRRSRAELVDQRDLRRHRQVLSSGSNAATTPANASNGVLDLTNAIQVSSDNFFYNLGALTNVHDPFAQPKGGALQNWARQLGIGRKTGDRPPRRGRRHAARRQRGAPIATSSRAQCEQGDRSVRRQSQARTRWLRDRRRDGPPLVGRRQRQPGGRSGRRPGDAAAAGRRLLGDRQRRHGRATAHRARDRRPPRHGPAADRPAAGAPRRHRPAYLDTIRAGPAGGGLAAGRHVGRRVRQTSRARCTARPAPPQYNGQQD